MNASTMKDKVFPPRATPKKNQWEATDAAARDIIAGELAAREAKSARLREQRVAREAAEPQPAPPAAKKRKRATK